MSFRCTSCGTPQEPRQKPIQHITETRSKEYINHGKDSYGWEICRVQDICLACAEGREESVEMDEELHYRLDSSEKEMFIEMFKRL